jgi:hypothetical protein
MLKQGLPIEPERRYSSRTVQIVAAFFALIFLVFWLRRPESLLHASFWAEDGSLFFRDQLTIGFWRAVVQPYNGYLNTVNRLVAALLSPLPFRWTPTAYSFCAILIQSASCGAFFLPNFRWIIAADSLRAACCLIAAAAIPASIELIGTVSNVHWSLSVLSLLLLVIGGRATTKRTVEILCGVVQVLIALSAPTTLLFVPFLAWQVKSKPAWLKLRPAVHLAAFCLQVWVMLHLPMPGPKPKVHFNTLFLSTLTSGLSRCVLTPAIGASYLLHDSAMSVFTKMVIALILCVAALTWIILRIHRSPRLWILLSALYVGAGSVLMAMAGRNLSQDFLTIDGILHFPAPRYFWVGASIFIFSVAFVIDTLPARMKPGLAVAMLSAIFALGVVRNFSNPSLNDFNWKESAAKLDNWEAGRRRHEKVGALSLPINPPGWAVSLDGDR